MPTLEDIYCKFGFASEAAQLLETELGTLLLKAGALEADLLRNPEPKRAGDLLRTINRQTLGQLIRKSTLPTASTCGLEELLHSALEQRNRLSHSFFREHNFRRNSDEGRSIMLEYLESIHDILLSAYTTVLDLSGFDSESTSVDNLPTDHERISTRSWIDS